MLKANSRLQHCKNFLYRGFAILGLQCFFKTEKEFLKETQQLRQQRTTCSITSCSTYRLRVFSHPTISVKVFGRGFFSAYCLRSSSHISHASASIILASSSNFAPFPARLQSTYTGNSCNLAMLKLVWQFPIPLVISLY